MFDFKWCVCNKQNIIQHMKECNLVDRAILSQPSKELPGETIVYVDIAIRKTIACRHDVERIKIIHFLKVFKKLTEVDLNFRKSKELIIEMHKPHIIINQATRNRNK